MDEIIAVVQGLHSLERSLRGQILCFHGLFACDQCSEELLTASAEKLR
jgi:hypothetical protein